MRTRINAQRAALAVGEVGRCRRRQRRGFTLVEAIIVLLLSLMLIASSISFCLAMNYNAARQAQYTAAMAMVEAGIANLRAQPYLAPNWPFETIPVVFTSNSSIPSLQFSSAGTSGGATNIPGTVTYSTIPVANGHLATVTGSFGFPGQPANTFLTVTLQAFVNKYSGPLNR